MQIAEFRTKLNIKNIGVEERLLPTLFKRSRGAIPEWYAKEGVCFVANSFAGERGLEVTPEVV